MMIHGIIEFCYQMGMLLSLRMDSGKIFPKLCSIWIIITLGIDLFASCFFMLSRWEEYVINKKDIHHRFSGLSSLAYRKGFLEKPIVNQFWVLT
ncbi:MAG: hypothetical protein RMJ51_02630 [Candidatus Calescibacterium sp.]|nr:hypothetical protein [Candidatus Calescibacterium sp.]MDW8195123.1 hypothetical protein [Candidatus Calescibacterium sp.]